MSNSHMAVGFLIILSFFVIPRLFFRGITSCPHCGASSYLHRSSLIFSNRNQMRFCSECGEEFEKMKVALESSDGLEKQEEVFCEHQFNSEGYKACVDLRYRVLREPLGLGWRSDELQVDKSDRHFALQVESKVVACATSHRLDAGRVKLRQMAVDPAYQGRGLGRRFLTELEETLWREGVKRIELHAREHAMGFYLSLGYRKIGSSFQEVGLAHYQMIKER